MDILIWITAGLATLFALDRLGLWMEAKGWLYYRRSKHRGSASGLFTSVDVFDPGVRHLETAREAHVLEDEDDGDDDGKRKRNDRVG